MIPKYVISALSFAFLLSCATMSGIFLPAKEIPSPYVGSIAKRPFDAIGGRHFLKVTAGMTPEEREARILVELKRGNIPNFLRSLKAVQVSHVDDRGQRRGGLIWVMPDYLAIGSNQDFVRIPMGAVTAQIVAEQFGFSLPTRKIVDLIYKQSQIKLPPRPMRSGPRMVSNDYYLAHHQTIQGQLKGQRSQVLLIGGHKKDVVISSRLASSPGRVAIYGWHRGPDLPIQPLSLVHTIQYADYSHGIRLVGGMMLVDGREMAVSDVLKDPDLAGLISDEGQIKNPRAYLQGQGDAS